MTRVKTKWINANYPKETKPKHKKPKKFIEIGIIKLIKKHDLTFIPKKMSITKDKKLRLEE